jgi:predicted acetyltransferase
MALTFGPVAEGELDELDALLGPALHFPGGTMREFIVDMVGAAHMRAVRSNGRIVGGLGAFPAGQWYGGRCVPIAAVTAVGVAPDARGQGVGAFMLRSSLEELRAAGTPLAALYPATLSFYRGAGYERAGYRITYELPLELITTGPRDPELALEPFGEEGYPLARELYAERARRTTGNLERTEWLWKFRMEPKDRRPFRFVARRGAAAEGYIVYSHGGRSDPLLISDLVALTPAAGRSFLGLLAGYRSMVEQVVWSGGVLDTLAYLLSENLTAGAKARVGVRNSYDWMLRIVDVAGALAARGYPPGLSAAVDLEVDDPTLPANAGRYRLTVADGRAEVTRGGAGRVRAEVRGLAALYTGFAAPDELRALGQIEGPEADLALLGAIFGGPRPWIPDMF